MSQKMYQDQINYLDGKKNVLVENLNLAKNNLTALQQQIEKETQRARNIQNRIDAMTIAGQAIEQSYLANKVKRKNQKKTAGKTGVNSTEVKRKPGRPRKVKTNG